MVIVIVTALFRILVVMGYNVTTESDITPSLKYGRFLIKIKVDDIGAAAIKRLITIICLIELHGTSKLFFWTKC